MNLRLTRFFFLSLLLMVLVPSVTAHSPLTAEENYSLETAYLISDPTKSWAIYAQIHGPGEAQYYRLEIPEDERLQVNLFVPTSEEEFVPTLVVMGPGITTEDPVPDFVEVPNRTGRKVFRADPESDAEYEPFTPMSLYSLVRWSWQVSTGGTYHLAVYDTSRGGRYGLAVGYRESFGLHEWILVPISAIRIHLWEGQSLMFIFSPLMITFSVGFGVLVWRKPFLFGSIFGLIGALAGLLYLGSGFMLLVQMMLALGQVVPSQSVILTLILGLLPIVLGSVILRISTSQESLTKGKRGVLIIFGLLGLFTWSGLLLGPALSIAASLTPAKMTFR